MLHFPTYLQALADRKGLRRESDGSRVTYRLSLAGTVTLTIVTDEFDPGWPGRVLSEAWPVPNTEAAHLEFMREALRFNRNALHHLHCGVRRDPDGGLQYRLIWDVPPLGRTAQEWGAQLQLFGRLADKAWQTLPRPGSRIGRKAPAADDNHVIFMP
jgi:hypothetical protein